MAMFKSAALLLGYLVSSAVGLPVESLNENQITSRAGEVLIFSDDFTTLDMNQWKHELTMGGGGNWEFQRYVNSRKNSFVQDGKLFIKPSLTADDVGEDVVYGRKPTWQENTIDMWGNTPADMCTGQQFYGCFRTAQGTDILPPISSARLRTAETFAFKYGRVEVRAKLPRGDWLWPAMWMMPANNAYGQWPASGEIDICESRGNGVEYMKDGKPLGLNQYGATLHWGPYYPKNGFPMTHKSFALTQGTFNDDFHTFGLYWSDERLFMYVDSEENVVMEVDFYGKTSFWDKGMEANYWTKDDFNPWGMETNKHTPFDREYYLILNLAVGGTAGEANGYFPDGVGNKPWSNIEPAAAKRFYDAKNSWLPTWTNSTTGKISDNAALQIDSVKVWGFSGKSTFTDRRPQTKSVTL
eukprot:TRINITY_DN1944_c0_g1::TRINITY_DN1944_c0_g1_i1::g.23088::m.23088 TRINITY_DN1944_c0_g1::TRINITY_DN1944_c0_g1_i1::g.23088  ORF type:complete len:427 (+),score=155.48,sp/Q8N0N3/BGBP_PENMO/47.26/1e-110,Glyco_hydro_16/PF00722.16/1.8e-18 TRINITY_DN1944_c0_g1_i1:46-1281(+)